MRSGDMSTGQLIHHLLSIIYKSVVDSINVTFMQIGHFYEAFGLDAVVLMQFCSLNPMGARTPPQAGTQYQNIARTVRDLVVNHGFSVVSLLKSWKPLNEVQNCSYA